jgi:hypothetical protein
VSRRELVLVGLLCGSVACSEACSSADEPSTDPLASTRTLERQALRERLWPEHGDGRFVQLASIELEALEQLVMLLLDNAERGRLSRAERRRAAALATLAGVELEAFELEGLQFWSVHERAGALRGTGAYLIRCGPSSSSTELILQAPHSFFDTGTGDIALAMLLESERARPRALFVNTVHRYRQLDGSKQKRAQNPADAAHSEDHPFARVTRRALELGSYTIVQLHGFSRNRSTNDPELIVSSGGDAQTRYSRRMLEQLRVELPEVESGLFGHDTEKLGARTNVQGIDARALGHCFVHLELSAELREALLGDADKRERFAQAVLELRFEGRGDCE